MVSIQPAIGVCAGFVDSRGRRLRRSVILAPVKIRVKGGEFTLSWMCNLAEECRNDECYYAKAKAERLGVQGF